MTESGLLIADEDLGSNAASRLRGVEGASRLLGEAVAALPFRAVDIETEERRGLGIGRSRPTAEPAAIETPARSSNRRALALAALVVLMALVGAAVFFRRRRSRRSETQPMQSVVGPDEEVASTMGGAVGVK